MANAAASAASFLLLLLQPLHVRVHSDDLPPPEDSKVVPVVARPAGGRSLVPLREGRAERQSHSKELQRVGSAVDLKKQSQKRGTNQVWQRVNNCPLFPSKELPDLGAKKPAEKSSIVILGGVFLSKVLLPMELPHKYAKVGLLGKRPWSHGICWNANSKVQTGCLLL